MTTPTNPLPISRRRVLRGGALVTAGWLSGAFGWLSVSDKALAQAAAAAGGGLTNWAMKTLANKAGNYVADLVWGQVMDMFGLPSAKGGGESAKLDQISAQLEHINRTLETIQSTLEDLQGKLDVVSNQITTHMSEENFKTHVNALNRLWGSSSDNDVPSLGALLSATRAGEQADVAGFARVIDQEVQQHMNGVYDALATSAGTNRSLLEQWTNLLIAKLYRPKAPDYANLERAYELLESYFLQGLGAQLKGVALRAARFGYKSGLDPAAATAKARTAFLNSYREEAERFLWSTEHLVFALTSIQSDADIHNGPLRIFRRADVLTKGVDALLAGQGDNVAVLFSGTYGRILCRASDQVQPGSKPGSTRINGAEVPGTLSRHPSGIPWAEFGPPIDSYPVLLPPSKALLKIVRVRAPYMTFPQLSKTLPNESPRTLPMDCCVNTETFEATTQRSANAVPAAGYVDRSRLAKVPGLAMPAYKIESAGNGMRGSPAVTPGTTSGLKQTVSIQVRTPAGWAGEPAMKHSFRQPFFMMSEESRGEKLTLVVRGALMDFVTQAFDPMPQMNNNLTLSLDGDDGSSVPIFKSTGTPVDRWDRANGFTVTAAIENRVFVNAQAGVKYDLVSNIVTKMRAPDGRGTAVGITESLSLAVDLAIIRPLVGDF